MDDERRRSEFLAEMALVKQFSEDAIRHSKRALELIDRENPDGHLFVGLTYTCSQCKRVSLAPAPCPKCCPEYYAARATTGAR